MARRAIKPSDLLSFLVSSANYLQLTDRVQALPPTLPVANRKLVAHESACPKCGQAALELSVMSQVQKDWSTEGESLKVDALPGQGPRLRG
jgi:hypothetical protein